MMKFIEEESVREEDEEIEEEEEEEEEEDDMDEDEAPDNLTSNAGEHGGHSSISTSREGSNIVITLTDPELLDCPICFEPLTEPVFQCDKNGHIACSLCCTKINNTCPSCSCTIRSTRCRAIEKVLESSTTSCQNIKYGCKIPVTYNKKIEHEMTCVFSPCSCPCVGCNFASSTKELYRHFSTCHLDWAKHFIDFMYDCLDSRDGFVVTMERNDRFIVVPQRKIGKLCVLHNSVKVLGNVVTLSCIQPSFMEDCNYKLLVTKEENSLEFQSVTKSSSSLQDNAGCPSSFLLIPCEFFNSSGRVTIDISIWPLN